MPKYRTVCLYKFADVQACSKANSTTPEALQAKVPGLLGKWEVGGLSVSQVYEQMHQGLFSPRPAVSGIERGA